MRAEEHIILVTGAGSGIGRATAELLVSEGATVVAADLDPSDVPTGAHAYQVDVADPESVDQLVSSAQKRHGTILGLANIAGVGSTTDILDCSPEEWDRVFAVNARGTFLCIRAVLSGMLARQHGSIVNLASIAGVVGLRDRAAYCASKGAVLALTKQVAIQWADKGIRCNAICPGTVDTPWVARLLADAPDPAATRAELIARQPMNRLGRPDEIASAVSYLLSDAAAFITGSELVIDGGICAA